MSGIEHRPEYGGVVHHGEDIFSVLDCPWCQPRLVEKLRSVVEMYNPAASGLLRKERTE